jgi:hypothetical protein
MKEVKDMMTYKNRNGYPMLRRCKNCVFWNAKENETQGLCSIKPYYFAFTLTPNRYPSTKDFFLCEEHRFYNEDKLKEVCEQMPLSEAIKNKSELD